MSSPPKVLKDKSSRAMARAIRDRQWEFMERALKHNPLWFCIWNKRGLPELENEWRDALISGMKIQEWMRAHKPWFRVGKWNEERYATPVRLTPAGRWALRHRMRYDMEPVTGGLVEPGWSCTPAPRAA